MTKPIKIVLLHLLILVLAGNLLVRLIGRERLVESIKPYRPYAIVLNPLNISPPDQKRNGKKKPFKIVFTGDSSLTWPPDVLPKAENFSIYTPGFLASALNDYKAGFAWVSQWSYPGANMFGYYCILSKAERFSPDLIVIPVNWNIFGIYGTMIGEPMPQVAGFAPLFETFSSGYENPLELMEISRSQHLHYKADMILLYPLGLKFFFKERLQDLAGFTFSDLKTTDEPDEFAGVDVGDNLRLYYPMEIDPSNVHYKIFVSTVDTAWRRKCRTLFYITPINLELLAEGQAFDEPAFTASKRLLESETQREYVHFLDLSGLLDRHHFRDEVQHYTQAGRQKIAEALATEVVEILENAKTVRLGDVDPAGSSGETTRF